MTFDHDPLLAAALELCRLKGFQVIPPGGEEWGYREAGRKRRLKRRWRGEYLETLRELDGRVRKTLAACSLSSNQVYAEKKKQPWFDRAMRMARGKVPFNEKEWSAALQIAAWMEASVDEPKEEVGDSELLRKTYRALTERPAPAAKASTTSAAGSPAQPATAPKPPSEPAEKPAGGPQRIDPALVEQGIGLALGVRKLRAEMDERRRRNWKHNAWLFRERPPPASQAASS